MSGTIQPDKGPGLPINDLPLTFAYLDGFLSTITTSYRGKTYVQTFQNDGNNITNISVFVEQP